MTESLRPMELGYAGTDLRRRLVELVLAGTKTATAGRLADHSEDDPIAAIGERFVLVDVDDRPVAVVETTEVRVVRAADVDERFARDEGEGFETVADWRAAHERFWGADGLDDDTQIVCERFRLVERLP
jgi:uncharacterized protein YhfF